MPTGAEQHQTRPRFTLPAPSVLRDRAGKMSEQLARKGSPRRRFLHEQRARLVEARRSPSSLTRATVPADTAFGVVAGMNP